VSGFRHNSFISRGVESGLAKMQTHETVLSFRKVVLGSNRKFGIVFGVVFAFFGIWPLVRHDDSPRWALLAASAAFLAASLFFSHWLTPLNRAWFKLGFALNQIVNPIIMGILFFGAVAPLGWYLRKTGKDLLRLEMTPEAETYWIERPPPIPGQGGLTKQY
jgi:hypothetical protein